MNGRHVGGEFLSLRAEVYLVQGRTGAALYDLRERKVWALPGVFAAILEACSDGKPFDSAAALALGQRIPPPALDAIRRFVRDHPALQFVVSPPATVSPPPLSSTIRPDWLMLEITGTCNLRCRHCYMSATSLPSPSVLGTPHSALTLPTSRWLELIAEGREIGFRALQLTGGEPAVHPDLPALLRLGHQVGYRPVALFTNLILLDDAVLSLLSQIGAQVHTSLYSLDGAVHDAATGQAGSWQRVVEGIRRLLSAGIETFVGVAVMQQNAATLRETVSFLTDMGIAPDHIKMDCAWPQGRGADLPPLAGPLLWKGRLDRVVVDDGSRLVAGTCWAGRLAIAPNGDVFVCVGEREALGNIASGSLRTFVESETVRSLWRITLDDVAVCSGCEFRYVCFDCRATAHLLSGDLLGRDPTCPYDPQVGAWRYEVISMSDKPKRKEGLVAENLDDDVVVADFRDSQLHILNPTAAAIWELCDGLHDTEQMAGLIAEHFGLAAEQVRPDVQRILGEFRAKGLIESPSEV